MRSLLTDFNSLSSDQGTGVIGSMSNINHSLETDFANKGAQSFALAKANQWQNEAAMEMAKNKIPPSAGAQSGWQQIANTGLNTVNSIVKSLQAGAPGTQSYDTTGPMWTGAQQQFTDFFQDSGGFSVADPAIPSGFGVDLSSGADFGGAWDGSIW